MVLGMTEEQSMVLWQAIAQFNHRQYYECHDTLEPLWMEATEPDRSFLQGILQIAVALYHLDHQNLRGAIILLGEGRYRLHQYCPMFFDVDITDLVEQSGQWLHILQMASLEESIPTGLNSYGFNPSIRPWGKVRG